MNAIANNLTTLSIWGMPLVWLAIGFLACVRQTWLAGACLAASGAITLLWNFLFMPIELGRNDDAWRVMTFVSYEDAPLGHFLSVYLPLLAKALLVLAVIALCFKREV